MPSIDTEKLMWSFGEVHDTATVREIFIQWTDRKNWKLVESMSCPSVAAPVAPKKIRLLGIYEPPESRRPFTLSLKNGIGRQTLRLDLHPLPVSHLTDNTEADSKSLCWIENGFGITGKSHLGSSLELGYIDSWGIADEVTQSTSLELQIILAMMTDFVRLSQEYREILKSSGRPLTSSVKSIKDLYEIF